MDCLFISGVHNKDKFSWNFAIWARLVNWFILKCQLVKIELESILSSGSDQLKICEKAYVYIVEYYNTDCRLGLVCVCIQIRISYTSYIHCRLSNSFKNFLRWGSIFLSLSTGEICWEKTITVKRETRYQSVLWAQRTMDLF